MYVTGDRIINATRDWYHALEILKRVRHTTYFGGRGGRRLGTSGHHFRRGRSPEPFGDTAL